MEPKTCDNTPPQEVHQHHDRRQNKKLHLRTLLTQEALPVGCFVGFLYWASNFLTHYDSWTSPTITLYIYTTLWFSACLLSLRVLISPGPLHVSCTGMIQNFLMLWGVSGRVEDGKMGEFVGAGVYAVVAAGVGYHLASRHVRVEVGEVKGDDCEVRGDGKA